MADAAGKGKRKAGDEGETEELRSIKRCRAAFGVAEPEAHLDPYEGAPQFIPPSEDGLMDYVADDSQSEQSIGASSTAYGTDIERRDSYVSLLGETTAQQSFNDPTYPRQHFQSNCYTEYHEPEGYGGWRFIRPTYKSRFYGAPLQPVQPLSIYQSGSSNLRPWHMGSTRFSFIEQQKYVYRRFPAAVDSLVSPLSPGGPMTPTQAYPPSPTALVQSELDYRGGWNSESDTDLNVDLDLSTVRASSPEPMELHELEKAPECAISSVIASILPSGSRTCKQRALVIALEYEGQFWNDSNRQSMRLQGPYADGRDIYNLLIEQSYQPEDIRVMTDYASTPEYDQPTLRNLEYALTKLVDGAQAGDRFFLYFAGHGKQVRDRDGDEADGYDEGIIPSDWSTSGYSDAGLVIDDIIRDTCVDLLPKGAQLTAVFDCCHSGTILDLPYEYSAKSDPFPKKAHNSNKATRTVIQHHERELVVITTPGEQPEQIQAELAPVRTRIYGSVDGRVLCFSACKDNQRAYARKRGLLTEAFTTGVRKLRDAPTLLGFHNLSRFNPTLRHLFSHIREHASLNQNGLVQDPMLSSSYRMNPVELNRQLVI